MSHVLVRTLTMLLPLCVPIHHDNVTMRQHGQQRSVKPVYLDRMWSSFYRWLSKAERKKAKKAYSSKTLSDRCSVGALLSSQNMLMDNEHKHTVFCFVFQWDT